MPYRDRLVRVDDTLIRTIRDLVEADLALRRGMLVELEVVRNGAPLTIAYRPPIHLIRLDWIPTAIFLVLLAFLPIYLILAAEVTPATTSMIAACLSYLVFVGVKPYYYENVLTNGLAHLGRLFHHRDAIYLWGPALYRQSTPGQGKVQESQGCGHAPLQPGERRQPDETFFGLGLFLG